MLFYFTLVYSSQYDSNGNLTNDGRRVFEYDYENHLTKVYVASAWKSVFQYDGFGRRRVRKEYGWSGLAGTLTKEVRYVYDANNLALVSDTSRKRPCLHGEFNI